MKYKLKISARPLRRAALSLLSCAVVATFLSGCFGGLRAAEEAPAGVDLSGQWQLAPGVREAQRVILDKAIDSQYAREREARRRWQSDGAGPGTGGRNGGSAGGGPGGSGPVGGGGPSAGAGGEANPDDPYTELQMAAPLHRVEKIRRQLEEMALPTDRLKLEQGADTLRFSYFDAKEPRRLRPGAALTVGFLDRDSANIVCGWSGAVFRIETRAEEQLTQEESLELIEHGQKLKYTVKLSGTLTGTVKLESTYNRVQ